MYRITQIFSGLLAFSAVMALSVAPSQAQQTTTPKTIVQTAVPPPGQSVYFYPGDRLVSNDGRFNMLLQSDGNLALLFNGSRIWSTGTTPKFRTTILPGSGNGNIPVTFVLKACFVTFQADGNLVVYGNEGVVGAADPCSFPNLTTNNAAVLWSSDSHGHSSPRLEMQNDGNLVIYDSSLRAVWATDTCCR